jgi:hypothetical protein
MCIANPFDLFPFVVRVYLLLLYWLLHQHLDKIMEKEKADMSVQQQHRHSCLCNMWARLYNITCVFPFFFYFIGKTGTPPPAVLIRFSYYWNSWPLSVSAFAHILLTRKFN